MDNKTLAKLITEEISEQPAWQTNLTPDEIAYCQTWAAARITTSISIIRGDIVSKLRTANYWLGQEALDRATLIKVALGES